MQYLAMRSYDIRQNLATEQYLMNNNQIKLPMVLFYIEKPCVIVGRNQNTIEEIENATKIKSKILFISSRSYAAGDIFVF